MSVISIIYAVIAVISLFLAIGYCCVMKRKELWLMLLYFSVFIVNCGYLSLSVSKSIEEALLANRISYLGSAFLPLCMLMTIMSVCRIGYRRLATAIFLPISCIVFLIAASPGYTDWYYKDVDLLITNGLTTLVKEYGPLHKIYLIYLISYFAIMLGVICCALFKRHIRSAANATILASTVLGNIAVWGIEQIIDIDFEFLSISYVITELFLLMLYIMLQVQEYVPSTPFVRTNNIPTPSNSFKEESTSPEGSSEDSMPNEGARHERAPYEEAPTEESTAEQTQTEQSQIEQSPTEQAQTEQSPTDQEQAEQDPADQYKQFVDGIALLTITERKIFDLYVSGKSTQETAEEVGIKENTLKFHNKNIYAKLGVSSRKQLLYLATLDSTQIK